MSTIKQISHHKILAGETLEFCFEQYSAGGSTQQMNRNRPPGGQLDIKMSEFLAKLLPKKCFAPSLLQGALAPRAMHT